jgi:hypothetical protein
MTQIVCAQNSSYHVIAAGTVYQPASNYYSSNYTIPGYWIDGVWTALPLPSGSTVGYVACITVNGPDIYAGGWANNNPNSTSQSDKYLVGYWKNGVWVQLGTGTGDGNESGVTSIVISGSDVYATAHGDYWINTAGYWKNGVWTALKTTLDPYSATSSNYAGAQANALAISGSDVYAAGSQYAGNDKCCGVGDVAGYWKNGVWYVLSDVGGPSAYYIGPVNSILVSGNNIYASGGDNYSFGGKEEPGYWLNSQRVSLVPSSSSISYGGSNQIVGSGQSIYISGFETTSASGTTTDHPGYWKDGAWNPATLPASLTQADGDSIAVFGGDVLLTGTWNANWLSGSTAPVGYWENSIWTDLPLPSDASSGSVTFVAVQATPISISTNTMPSGTVNTSYSQQLNVTGGTPPYTWSATGIPPGLNLSNSGILSGIPTVAGSYTPVFTVTDSANEQASETISVTINEAQATPPAFSPAVGTYSSVQSVTLSDSTPNAIIYYTTDGSTPTIKSALYGTPITVASTETIQAIATASGYLSSIVASGTYTIQLPAPTITSISPASATVGGAAFTLTINGTNFTSGATAQWGSTSLATTYVSATQLTAAVPASLIATAGTANVTVTTSGGTTSAATFTVNAAPLTAQTITFANPGAQTVGTPLTLSASATSGLTVTFTSTTTSVCTVAGTQATFLTAGTCTIDANQAGNSTYAAATMVPQSFTVNAAPLTAQTITFANPGTQTVGTPLTLSASATSGLTVTFTSTTTSVCTVAGTQATFLTAGTCTIDANQAGNSTYAAATMVPQSFTVNAAQTNPASFALTGTAVTVAPGASTGNTSSITVTPAGGFTGNVNLTANITSSPSGAVDTPTLSFGSTSPVDITGTAAGTATLTISTTAATTSSLAYPQIPGSRGTGTPWYAAGGATLACLLLFGIPARRRYWRSILGVLVLLAALTEGIVACGGGSNSNNNNPNPGTTLGSYTVTVTGTDVATSEIKSTTTLNLTVN